MLNRLHIDSEFAFETVRGIPQAVSEGVLREWEGRKHVPLETPKGRRINPQRGVMGIHVPDDRPRNANIWLRHISETIRGLGLPRHVLIDENDITAKAKALARRVGWMCRNGASLVEVQALARLYAVDLPDPGKAPHTEQSVWLRASNPVWWRRQIRKASHRTLERGAIIAGRVHNRAGLYASDDAVKRLAARKRQSRELLAMTQVINELGQSYTLEELAALSTSNPLIRRAELMVRLRGFEQYAKEEGHVCDFITLTCPGSYHPRLSKTGAPNPGYNPLFGPRESQMHLRTVWARARAKLARAGVRMYGFRVAEPHHDGTPHWHMVLFFEGQYRRIVRKVMRHYALQVEPNQPGAWRRRCTFKTIDLVNGSACGYVAKYIAKNVDGRNHEGLSLSDFDHESNPTDPQLFSESAFRVEALGEVGHSPIPANRCCTGHGMARTAPPPR
ncbi:replication endonuclease [Paludibacterium denitrificans]|uniref:Replication gene A protein-like domain-containing protein n=1 Tax=Paludibacterium denitrificans TaxID=2675226 RepID=A0A844GDR8_9NEIS|nr:replication endonuclease [Paludibacterium denitrificans]MTD33912.1 hypothetical protein [Paludibacterium denitrificans]